MGTILFEVIGGIWGYLGYLGWLLRSFEITEYQSDNILLKASSYVEMVPHPPTPPGPGHETLTLRKKDISVLKFIDQQV